MRAYKVLAVLPDGTRVSPIAPGGWALTYRPGRKTQAWVGKVFVHRTLEDAIAFVLGEKATDAEIWEVEAEGVERREAVPADSRYFWDFWQEGTLPEETIPLPEGVLLAESVTLLSLALTASQVWDP